MERIRIKEAVIVEGKYDKIRLESVIDALIITTDGFGIFKEKEKIKLLRTLARERGLLVLTDSDGAGFVIRRYISGCIDPSQVKHVYIPQLSGKERRKKQASKEGTLGVEGMSTEVITEALSRAGVNVGSSNEQAVEKQRITREMLFDDGFIGGENSARRRKLLLEKLGLPSYLSTSALVKIINMTSDIERYESAVAEVEKSFSKL